MIILLVGRDLFIEWLIEAEFKTRNLNFGNYWFLYMIFDVKFDN